MTEYVQPLKRPTYAARFHDTPDRRRRADIETRGKRRYTANLRARLAAGDPTLKHGSAALRGIGCLCQKCRPS